MFDKIFSHLTASDGPPDTLMPDTLMPDTLMPDTLMIDATHLKAHRTASSLLKGRFFPATSGAQKAGRTPDSMPSAMATDDGHVPAPAMCLTAGQLVGSYRCEALVSGSL